MYFYFKFAPVKHSRVEVKERASKDKTSRPESQKGKMSTTVATITGLNNQAKWRPLQKGAKSHNGTLH